MAEVWDYMRFLYESEATQAAQGLTLPGISIPPYAASEPPDWDNLEVPRNAAPSGDRGAPSSDFSKLAGKDLDSILSGGSAVVSPCWMLNNYTGPGISSEGPFTTKLITGKTILTTGNYNIVTKTGWMRVSGILNDSSVQAFVIYLDPKNNAFPENISTWVCATYGTDGQRPASHEGLPQIGTVSGDSLAAFILGSPLSSMWTRFKACMRTHYPQC